VLGCFGVVVAVLYLAGGWTIRLVAPGSADRLILEATRIEGLLLPVLLFQSAGGVLAGMLLSRRSVLAPPLSMCLLYLSGLMGLWMTVDGRAERLSIALTCGAALQVLALGLLLWSRGELAWPAWQGTLLGSLASHALPILGCNAISTLFLVSDRSFAASLGPGQVAAVSYVFSLITMPTQIIVNAVIGVCMPGWVSAGRNPGAFSESVTRALALLSFALLPIAIAMTLAADPLTRLVLGATRFTPSQIDSTAGLLALYCPAILGFAAKDALTAAAVAQGRSFAAFCVGAGSLAAAILAKSALVPFYGATALAHGTTFALALAVAGLLAVLSVSGETVAIPQRFWRYSKEALLSAIPAIAAGIVATHLLPGTGWAVAGIALFAYAAVWFSLGGPASGLQLIRGRW
jgi:peptidoglycan biosynthesis protein MviN/MurJ (putative lipid II flippase)